MAVRAYQRPILLSIAVLALVAAVQASAQTGQIPQTSDDLRAIALQPGDLPGWTLAADATSTPAGAVAGYLATWASPVEVDAAVRNQLATYTTFSDADLAGALFVQSLTAVALPGTQHAGAAGGVTLDTLATTFEVGAPDGTAVPVCVLSAVQDTTVIAVVSAGAGADDCARAHDVARAVVDRLIAFEQRNTATTATP